MKFSVPLFTLYLSIVHGLPSKRETNTAVPSETVILNYALTLEHLENAFYTQGLLKYSESDFINDGFDSSVRGRFVQIAEHEAGHVKFLQSALGSAATKPCTYKFPDTSPQSFAAVSTLLENVGTSAYSGAAHYLSGGTLTAAAAILAVEARHSAWVSSEVLQVEPWNTAFDTPLDLDQIYTLASSVIESCPASNPQLPVKAFPTLTFPWGTQPGSTVKVSYGSLDLVGHSVAFVSGHGFDTEPILLNLVRIPETLRGVVYAFVVSEPNKVTDDAIVAGPAFLRFDF
ncbi:ferritin-like domain-containing protein [Hygrophoropsis aurantiaca]|uniref:Ferritin-like domain-containing protein n=1 Tax=Hygrophoropsis aurantiaca TaxID=72124 RepID=A0ACB8AGB4_9AGAM|nr:ferritin-like domain-containing protein [Hygrophoropsis aurantiaca]